MPSDCAELRRWSSALTDTGITVAMHEAFAKFDYVIRPGQCLSGIVWAGVTHRSRSEAQD